MADPYVYEGTNILQNKAKITNADFLKEFERNKTVARLQKLSLNPSLADGSFDLKHLQKIHGYIFQDVYEWAGKLRTVQIEKGTVFCPPQNIEGFAEDIGKLIKRQDYLKNMDKETFSKNAGVIFGQVNALHPFREGNGRAQREFMRQLAWQAGWKLNFQGITQEQMIKASIDGFNGKYDTMAAIFEDSLEKAPEQVKIFKKTKSRGR